MCARTSFPAKLLNEAIARSDERSSPASYAETAVLTSCQQCWVTSGLSSRFAWGRKRHLLASIFLPAISVYDLLGLSQL